MGPVSAPPIEKKSPRAADTAATPALLSGNERTSSSGSDGSESTAKLPTGVPDERSAAMDGLKPSLSLRIAAGVETSHSW